MTTPAPIPETTSGDDLPTVATYVAEYAWDCPECDETQSTGDVDEAGTVQTCEDCGQSVRLTT